MQINELSNNPKLVIGVKQTTKVLASGHAELVFIAKDAEQHVVRRIIQLATEQEIEIIFIDTMKELGRACNIDVGAATAVIEK
ncbi:ribosomal L7Ae/L30e/S12e/Gadd45 family protein [Fusibacter ferrireducens]|uniref:Ribosomal L7Ae/L30e/S12e/Gadd45 family protein n=1 Tax=Fusibacter ferrireducens TaxID=2785058 RepID=A0ABS0A0A2_9FIRM|nr:ribosomal L7Ae/L30e/S12e/Gadd45 family protein [Fusibacter ferrireducens]MBF4695853.1 ribosomal L7Ae/L30e/S12e/Gadd45 family protein [Fusibacter ferrireducens]